jgi:YggT family protein
MFILGNLLKAVAIVIHYVLNFYMWIVIIRALLSWVNPDPYNPIVKLINNLTEPVMYQIRKRIPVMYGGIDLSPVIVILVIVFLQNFVVDSLYSMARALM